MAELTVNTSFLKNQRRISKTGERGGGNTTLIWNWLLLGGALNIRYSCDYSTQPMLKSLNKKKLQSHSSKTVILSELKLGEVERALA